MKRTKSSKRKEPISAEDAALLARLEALPKPRWLAPLLAYKTHAQRMKEFYRELDRQSAELSADDAALLARLEALPDPIWLAPMLAYRSHTQRMAEFYRELDKHSKPLIWHPIGAERVRLLLVMDWKNADKRRREVQETAALRGDVFSTPLELS